MTVPVVIDAAKGADLPALKEMIEGAYRGEHARMGWTHEADLVAEERITPEKLTEIYADPDVAIFVARSGPDIVGCVTVSDGGADVATIGLLCVDPPFQSSGLGSRLLNVAEQLCSHMGATTARMTVIDSRAPLLAWYIRQGYRNTGEREPFPDPQEEPLFFVMLEKTIDPA